MASGTKDVYQVDAGGQIKFRAVHKILKAIGLNLDAASRQLRLFRAIYLRPVCPLFLCDHQRTRPSGSSTRTTSYLSNIGIRMFSSSLFHSTPS